MSHGKSVATMSTTNGDWNWNWEAFHDKLPPYMLLHMTAIKGPINAIASDRIDWEDRWSEFCTMKFKGWIQINLLKPKYFAKVYVDWDLLFSSILGNLWLYRNSFAFNNPLKSYGYTFDHSHALQATMLKAIVLGWFKLNSDGAQRLPDGRAKCGGTIRDSNGNWILGFSKGLGVCWIMEAELWGVYTGLLCARNLNLRDIEIEVDSLKALCFIKLGAHGQSNKVADQMMMIADVEDLEVRLFHDPPLEVGRLLHEEVGA
ncbi:hypothetical protein V6N11_018091 [Hibiscus sabdariffa]|uniref:RNase H type-1 domain-containing protein n=1 Tax=Hibiscus sabdariffa TaxID=183260 RepID=A0ABR2T7B2_9ROSI